MTLTMLCCGLFAALALSAAMAAVAYRTRRRFVRPSAWGAISLAAACSAARWMIFGLPGWPPSDCIERLADSVLAAGLLEVALRGRGASRGVTAAARGALWLAVVAALVEPLARNSWSAGQTIAWTIGMAAAGWAWLALLDWLGALAPLVTLANLAVVALGSAIALGLSGSAALAILQAALFLALAPQAILAAARSELAPLLARSGFAVLTVALLGGWIDGYHYSELPAGSAIALTFAPIAGMIGAWRVTAWRPARRAALAAGLNLALVGAAIAIAVRHFEPQTPGEYGPPGALSRVD